MVLRVLMTINAALGMRSVLAICTPFIVNKLYNYSFSCYCRQGFNYDGQYCQPTQGSIINNPCKYQFSITKHDLTVSSLITQRQQQCSPNEISIGGRCYRKSSYFDECDFSQQCNFVGGICDQHRCKCSYLDIYNDYQCVRDQMLPGTSNHYNSHSFNLSFLASCQDNQILINNQCYPIANINEPCALDKQCRSTNLAGNIACINNVCQQIGLGSRPRDQGGNSSWKFLKVKSQF
jgi:hypothetical protein